MKVALIPPIPRLDTFAYGDFHLLLSHLLDNPKYRQHYTNLRRRGAYLVLDNSAHEFGKGDNPIDLLMWAYQLRAQEIVVPDVLDDADATVERATQTLETWFEADSNYRGVIDSFSPALMYVPQGKNFDDWLRCLDELIRMHLYVASRFGFRRDFVIGLSKDYEVWDGGLLRIIDEALAPIRIKLATSHGVKVNVHLLGWGRKLWDLKEIAKKHPWIRSTDSAKPFVYALAGDDLMVSYIQGHDPPPYPKRPANYFNRRMGEEQVYRAASNVELYAKLANPNYL